MYSQALSHSISCCSAPDIYCGVAKRRRRSGRSTGADYSPSVHRAACALDSGEPRLKEDESAAEQVGIVSSVQLLPSLTVMAKLLSAVYDSRPDRQPDQDLLGNMSGSWRMRTTHSTANSSADSYQLKLSMSTSLGAEGEDGEGEVEASEDDERASEDNAQESKPFFDSGEYMDIGRGAAVLQGTGTSVVATVTAKGAQVGSRVKFGEEWTMDDRRGVVEGSVSMCGSYFKGTFTDLRTKKVSELVGVRPEYTNNSSHARKRTLNGIVLKTCVLGMMACGRLSCQLMLGWPSPKANLLPASRR